MLASGESACEGRQMDIQIESMTTAEKLFAMERLWNSLQADEAFTPTALNIFCSMVFEYRAVYGRVGTGLFIWGSFGVGAFLFCLHPSRIPESFQ